MQWSNNQRQAPLEISYQTVEMHKKKFCWNPQAVELLVFGESFQGICICIRTQMGLLVISRWFKGYVFLIRKLLCRCYRSLQLALPGFPRFWAKSPPSSPTRPLSALFLFRTSVNLARLSPLNCHSQIYVFVLVLFLHICITVCIWRCLFFPRFFQAQPNHQRTW